MLRRVVLFVVSLSLMPLAAAAQTAPAAPAPVASPSDPAVATPPTVLIASGAPLKITLVHQLASNSAHTDDPFAFHAADDVVVDGWVVIAKGAIGEGHVISAESSGGNGHPGKLQLQFDWIYDTDNLKVKLSDVPSTNNGDAAKGASSTATIASYLVLGPLGLFAHNFVHGKDVIVKSDQKIEVYVAQSVHVAAVSHPSTVEGFAH